MTLDEYFEDWMKVIDRTELNNVMAKVGQEYRRKPLCPAQSDVFRAFELCPLNDLKVVMLGQDPYPQKGVATGVLFGNRKEVDEDNLSPSLNVVKEAAINFEVPHYCITFDQTLESWAKQGILMINSALTVEMNRIGSHVMLWRPFIAKLLKNLSEYNTAIVYVLFGRQAQTFKPYINDRFNHIIEIEHPAYFARSGTKMPHQLFIDISNKVKEIYLTNGKEVQIGDTLTKVSKVVDPFFGEGAVVQHIVVTKDILPKLLEAGIVTTTKPAKSAVVESEVPMELEYYIQKIAERLGWKIEKVYNYLNSVDTILPAAAFSMVLREVAIELDKKYEDHIEKSPEIYVISMLDGRITKANKAHIKNYRNFAAFRTIEDAKIACRITRDILKEMFKSGK